MNEATNNEVQGEIEDFGLLFPKYWAGYQEQCIPPGIEVTERGIHRAAFLAGAVAYRSCMMKAIKACNEEGSLANAMREVDGSVSAMLVSVLTDALDGLGDLLEAARASGEAIGETNENASA
jgi:hypothetical protein